MPRKIAFARIIDRKNPKQLSRDPAQFGGYRAAISETDKLTIAGPRGVTVFRADHARAARWENEDTLLYIDETPKNAPYSVKRAFRSRVHRDWQTESVAGSSAIPTPDGSLIAVIFTLPNPSVAVLKAKMISQPWIVRTNLGTSPESVEWDEKSRALTVTTPDAVYKWQWGKLTFLRTIRADGGADDLLADGNN